MEVARLTAVLEAETRQAEADLQRAAGAVDNVGRTAGRQGGAAQAMGRAFSAAGATAGYAFAAGVESAATFEDGLRTINTIAGLSDQQLATLGDGIQQVSRDTGKTTEELTQAYYDLLSAGTVAGDDITGGMEALRSSATLAIGGLSSTGEAVDLVSTALNSWQLGADQAGRATDIFATAIERGKVTASGIAGSLANAAPLAASMGIEMEEVAASYATLTARGVPASEAMTQMNAAMRALINPNEQLNAIQERTGINFAELARQDGLVVALERLKAATDETAGPLEALSEVSAEDFPNALKSMQEQLGLTNSEVEAFAAVAGKDGAGAAFNELVAQVGMGDSALAGALGRVEGFNFVLQTTGDAASVYGDNLEYAFERQGIAAEQAAEKMKSPVEAAARLTAGITTFLQDVGGPFASTMGPILLTMNNLGPAFLGPLSPARLLGSAVGWFATKALVPAITGLGNFGIALAKGVVFMAGFTGALIKDGLTALGNFIIRLGAAGLAALRFGARLAVQAVASIAKFVFALAVQSVAAIGGFAASIFTTAIPALVALVAPFAPILLAIGAVIAIVGALWLAWENNFLGIRDIAANVWAAITGFIDTAVTNITGFVTGLIDFIGGLWDGVVETAQGVWDAIVGAIETAVGAIVGIIGGIIDVVAGVAEAVGGFFASITGNTEQAKAQLNSVSGAGGGYYGNRVPEYSEGTLDTGQGGLALLHPREAVLPAEVASALRGWLGSGGPRGDVAVAQGGSNGMNGAAAGTVVYQTNHYRAEVEGILPVRSVRDIARGLRVLGESGQLVSREAQLRAAANG